MIAEFRSLINALRREEKEQEKLFNLLLRERAAIVKLNQSELDSITEEKSKLLEHSRIIENDCQSLVQALGGEKSKLSDVIAKCSDKATRTELAHLGQGLKSLSAKVQEINTGNGRLLKQALGLVGSTLAIFRSAPGTELPTYNGAGAVKTKEDPAFTTRRSGVRREA